MTEVKRLERGGVSLAYRDLGQSTGEPVTLLHGFTQEGTSWLELIDLMPPGYRWLMPDLRGHGRTRAGGQPHTPAACASDLLELWRSLGIEASHLVGYSMGGRLALHLAASGPSPVLSLVAIGARAGIDGRERELRAEADARLAATIERDGIETFVDLWLRQPLLASLGRRGPGFMAAQRATRLRSDPAGWAAALRGMGPAATPPLGPDRLAAIACPSLFLAGEEDATYVRIAAELARAVPAGAWATIPAAGHSAHLENPAACADLIAAHLASAHRASAR